jgi:hypothetical protein
MPAYAHTFLASKKREREGGREGKRREVGKRGGEKERRRVNLFFPRSMLILPEPKPYNLYPQPQTKPQSCFEHLFFLQPLLASSNLNHQPKLNLNTQHLTLFASGCSSGSIPKPKTSTSTKPKP